jgi:uncharacterized protein
MNVKRKIAKTPPPVAGADAAPAPGSCDGCGGQCCRYVALEWDKPAGKRAYDHIRWFLLHENVAVFIDTDRKWFVEFQTPCSALAADGRCADYAARPLICRQHGEGSETQCEIRGEGSPYLFRFETARAFERYLDERGVDWRFKRFSKEADR